VSVRAIWVGALVAGAGVLAWQTLDSVRHSDTRPMIRFSRPLDSTARAFADDVTRTIGAGALVYAMPDVGRIFVSQIGVRLAYRGTPYDIASDSQWTALEKGTATEIQQTITALGLRYVLIQTAESRPRVWQLCAHDAPAVRSGVFTVDASTHYFFEVYALDRCREAPR
jgi:hypothetical protein